MNILYGSDKGKQKNMKIKFCDAMHEILIGQDLFSRIMPRDQAPEKCPVQPVIIIPIIKAIYNIGHMNRFLPYRLSIYI